MHVTGRRGGDGAILAGVDSRAARAVGLRDHVLDARHVSAVEAVWISGGATGWTGLSRRPLARGDRCNDRLCAAGDGRPAVHARGAPDAAASSAAEAWRCAGGGSSVLLLHTDRAGEATRRGCGDALASASQDASAARLDRDLDKAFKASGLDEPGAVGTDPGNDSNPHRALQRDRQKRTAATDLCGQDAAGPDRVSAGAVPAVVWPPLEHRDLLQSAQDARQDEHAQV